MLETIVDDSAQAPAFIGIGIGQSDTLRWWAPLLLLIFATETISRKQKNKFTSGIMRILFHSTCAWLPFTYSNLIYMRARKEAMTLTIDTTGWFAQAPDTKSRKHFRGGFLMDDSRWHRSLRAIDLGKRLPLNAFQHSHFISYTLYSVHTHTHTIL